MNFRIFLGALQHWIGRLLVGGAASFENRNCEK